MPKGGFHSVTLSDQIFDILSKVSKSLNKSIPETIYDMATGNKIIHGVLFAEEHICVDCGYRPSYNIGKCPSVVVPLLRATLSLR